MPRVYHGETKVCEQCSSTFSLKGVGHKRSEKRRFCSHVCYRKYKEEKREWLPVENRTKYCEGCGKPIVIPLDKINGYTLQRRRFCNRFCVKGTAHPNWDGGKYRLASGYVKVYVEGEGRARYEHQVVAEKALGRPLRKGECVHHINCNKADNRNSNLLVCTNEEHQYIHNEMSRRYAQEKFGTGPLDSDPDQLLLWPKTEP